jgi:hypothetical protein
LSLGLARFSISIRNAFFRAVLYWHDFSKERGTPSASRSFVTGNPGVAAKLRWTWTSRFVFATKRTHETVPLLLVAQTQFGGGVGRIVAQSLGWPEMIA